MADTAFNHVMECTGLLRTIAEDENLAGIHNGADTHGESLLGNLGFIVVEERQLAWMVLVVRVLMRVLEERLLPGSLKAI